MKIAVSALVLAGVSTLAASAQEVSRSISVNVSVIDTVTEIYINQSTASPTFNFALNTVDALNQTNRQEFDFCVTGTTAGGYQVRNDTFDSSIYGTGLAGAVFGTGEMRANVSIPVSAGSSAYITVTGSENYTYAYGSDCSVADAQTLVGRIEVGELSGVTSVPADTYTGVVSLTVVPV